MVGERHNQKKDDNSLFSSETPPKADENGEQAPLTPDNHCIPPTVRQRQGPAGSLSLCFPEHLLASRWEAWEGVLQGLMGNSPAF